MSKAIQVIYKAAPGSRISDTDAGALGAAINALGSSVTPAQLVQAAKQRSSPLHRFFEWDDAEAAASYRIDQARYYLRSVWEVPVDKDDRPTSGGARAFHVVEYEGSDETEGRAYFSTREMREIPGADSQVIERAIMEAVAWKKRFQRLQEHFPEVFRAIDAASRRLTKSKPQPRRKGRRKKTA